MMPALRNRQIKGARGVNGLANGQQEAFLAKLHKIADEDTKGTIASSYTNNNEDFSDQEEQFLDTRTMGAQAKMSLDEDPIIFGLKSATNSVAQAATDQFAVALLRLQSDLDATSRKLEQMEVKLDKQLAQLNSSRTSQSDRTKKNPSSVTNKLIMLAYLGWPIAVFVAMRAIERRALAKSLA